MDSTLTYGELYQRLQDLHFSRREVDVEGKARYLFEHPKSESALLFLPIRKLDEVVEAPFIRSVLVLLKTHHLIEEPDPLDLLRNGQSKTTVS